MPAPSHIRRIVVIAALGCAMLAGWTSAAAARPIDDPTLHTGRAAERSTVSASEVSDRTLPIMLAGAVVLLVVGTAYGARRSHRARA